MTLPSMPSGNSAHLVSPLPILHYSLCTKRFMMCTLHYELFNRSNSLRIMDYAQFRTQYALSNLHCALCSIQCILSYLVCTKLCGTGRVPKQKTENFQRGGGESFLIQKFMLHIFFNFLGGFLCIKLIQKSYFRVQGMFFQQLY